MVLAESRYGAIRFGAELMRKRGRELAGGDERLAEGRIVVMRDYFPTFRCIFANVSVGIIRGEIELVSGGVGSGGVVADNREKTTDAAGTLQRTVQVEAPDVNSG